MPVSVNPVMDPEQQHSQHGLQQDAKVFPLIPLLRREVTVSPIL